MANTTPRRRQSAPTEKRGAAKFAPSREDTPWTTGDPTKKIGINVPFPETLMLQLDYLVENKAIRSKSSFIREVVEAAAIVEVERLWRVKEAVRRIEEEDRVKR
ncbi:hypothetical protein [Burkholderia mayonis]|uniref:CopG family transcriptional regulator n=1 Tax=Burkholderia mayonis TaxID=1385591 RepID=A0A1B4G193_9BURK|nr:hypothetical protein [Burkholderia mayonis]AOJ09668.1 hypothetical protein WS71_20395 [Burkholderia mayonis]KVE52289.1 hypothetical protein WS71_10220 [Burkholderia mayonis]